MPNYFTVYSKPDCPYCVKAKDLLTHHGLSFVVINIDTNPFARAYIRNEGHTTVPQVYLTKDLLGEHLGGYEELAHFIEANYVND